MRKPYRVAVCGAGIAGTTVAFLLAEDGHHVTLFERAERCGPVGAGILLQPTGQAVLRELGMLERLRPQTAVIRRLRAATSGGRQLTDLPYAELGDDVCALGVHRGNLFTMLLNRCVAANVELVEGCPLDRYEHGSHDVRLFDAQGGDRGRFDFVVAADGSRSALRQSAQLSSWSKEYAHAALWAVGTNEQVTDELYQIVEGTHVLVGLLPTGGGRCSFFWGLRARDWPQLRSISLDRWKRRVAELCPAAESTLTQISGWDALTFATYRQVWLKRWVDRRVVFVGDAAHAMSPHLGQGVNFALLDAWGLAQDLASTTSVEGGFAAYEHRRRARTLFYWWLTRGLTPFFQSDGRVRGWGRDLCLPWMPRVPWLRRQMLRSMAGLKEGWLC